MDERRRGKLETTEELMKKNEVWMGWMDEEGGKLEMMEEWMKKNEGWKDWMDGEGERWKD